MLEPKLECDSNATFRHKTESRQLIRREMRQFRELFRRWVEVDVGIHHKHLSARENQARHGAVNGRPRPVPDHLIDIVQMPRRGADGSADHSIRFALF